MSWLPKRDKLDPVQASAIDVAAVVRELIQRRGDGEVQQEGYDSWEGFVSAGFAAEDDVGIHLAGTKGWCSVWRGGELLHQGRGRNGEG